MITSEAKREIKRYNKITKPKDDETAGTSLIARFMMLIPAVGTPTQSDIKIEIQKANE